MVPHASMRLMDTGVHAYQAGPAPTVIWISTSVPATLAVTVERVTTRSTPILVSVALGTPEPTVKLILMSVQAAHV